MTSTKLNPDESGNLFVDSGAKPVGITKMNQPVPAASLQAGARARSNARYGYTVTDQMRANPFAVRVVVTKEDRMDDATASAKLNDLRAHLGVAGLPGSKLWAFDSALWFCHTLNGASSYSDGRAVFGIDGREFKYAEVLSFLGADTRRFFRAFADDIRNVNAFVLDYHDADDHEAIARRDDLLRTAYARGMSKHPEYCHDSADACSNLTIGIRNAIAESKEAVLSKAHVGSNEPGTRSLAGGDD